MLVTQSRSGDYIRAFIRVQVGIHLYGLMIITHTHKITARSIRMIHLREKFDLRHTSNSITAGTRMWYS